MLNFSLRAAVPLLLAAGISAQAGSFIGTIPAPNGENPVGLGVSPQGEVLMTTTAGNAYRLNSSGTQIATFRVSTNTGTPNGITSDGVNFYLTDSNATTGGRGVDVYDAQGVYVRSFAVTPTFPAGICWNPSTNHLFIVDRVGAQVYEYDLQGNQIAASALPAQINDGIAYDVATNTFWVYEITGDLVHNMDAQFNVLSNFAGPVASVSASGRGIALVGGILYIAIQSQQQMALFDTTGTSAAVSTYGEGCPRPGVFYEQFLTAGSSDLSGLAFTFTATGTTGYAATRGGTFETNIGTGLNMVDDQIDRALPLGFTFNIPGSTAISTTAIDISSNGWVGLIPNQIPDTGFYVGATGDKMVLYERICTWWDDLDPSVAGDVHFNTLSNPTRAVITWNQVSQFGATPPDSNTIQLQLYPSGNFVLIFQAGCLDEAIVGYSSGGSPTDPGSFDLTAMIPGNFGPYGAPVGLTSNRPVIGTTLTYQASNIPAGTTLAALIFGSAQTATPLDAIGMSGCTLLSSGDLATAPMNVGTGAFSFGVPNQTALIGATLHHQAIVIAPGVNLFGAAASNGLTLRIGT